MSSRFKVDEDLPRQVSELLSARGHDATTVVLQGWQGLSDESLWPRVQTERRWLVTADKGFGDLRKYPPGTHGGVILLRPQEESRRAFLELAEAVADKVNLDDLAGSVIVATPAAVRVRRAPIKR